MSPCDDEPSYQQRYQQVTSNIGDLCAKHGRNPKDVQLLAVSKTKPIDAIEAVQATGQRLFGENYLQEAVKKRETLSALPLEWHFIGPLQSNKTKLAAENMDWVQTVDRLKIAQRLSDQRPGDLPDLNVLLQVNISNEASKSGIASKEVGEYLEKVSELPHIALRGLMTIPEAHTGIDEQRREFARMRKLYEQYQSEYGLDTLSMGMSGDMEAAIAEGSTMLRIGTALFGARG